ncbi:MAG: monovalent cation/H(+) antiporter subunit G [Desulfurococcales archaeon]|nr:monovalent cation/H(+) antiporter subunit G [Desulfurococcales archaeon]
MVFEVVEWIIFYIGLGLTTLGALCDLFGSLGLLRFPNFYVRLHAATVGIIGGAVVPLIGVGLMSLCSSQLGVYRFAVATIFFLTAFVTMIVAPIGTHALAYASHRGRVVKVEPKVIDMLEKHRGGEK